MAWLLSLREADKSLPVFPLSAVLTGAVAFLLMRQPDFGSTIIFVAVWIAMLALAGVSLRMLGMLGGRRAGRDRRSPISSIDVATARIDGFLFGRATPSRPTMRCAR